MIVGYIGLGAMGGALARQLIPDYPLQVWDLNPAAMERLVREGAQAATSLPEMARQCDVIFLCLPRTANVEQAIFGPDGLSSGLSRGQLLIDQTSGIPAETAHLAERLAPLGVSLVDAPVAGGVANANAGKITMMMSGPDEAYARAKTVAEKISPHIYRAGQRTGDGQATKIVNNIANGCYRIATLEIAALGRKLGLPMAQISEALARGPGANFCSQRVLPKIVSNESSVDFALALMVKDCNQAA